MTRTADSYIEEYFSSGTIADLPRDHFIGGAWVAPASGQMMETFDPGKGRAYHSFAAGNAEDIERAVKAASSAEKEWGRMKPSARGAILAKAAELIRKESA